MSDHVVSPIANPIEGYSGLRDLVTLRLRAPVSVRYVNGTMVYGFTPDLTAQEATTFATLVGMARGATLITVAEREALEPFLGTLRSFQQMSRNEFVNLAGADRERLTFDVLTALLRVERALLRD